MCIYRYWLWQFFCLFIWTKLYVWTFKRFFKTNNVSIVAWKAWIMFIFSLCSLDSEDTCYWCYFGENQCIPASDVLLKRMCLSCTAMLLSQSRKTLCFLSESRSMKITLKQFLILGRCFMICPALPWFFSYNLPFRRLHFPARQNQIAICLMLIYIPSKSHPAGSTTCIISFPQLG